MANVRFPDVPCPPEDILPAELVTAVMNDPRRYEQDKTKFSIIEIAAVYADVHHPMVDKKLRPMIARLLKENAAELHRKAKEKAKAKKK